MRREAGGALLLAALWVGGLRIAAGWVPMALMGVFLIAVLGWPTPAGATDFGDPGARMRVYWFNGQLMVGVYPRANEGYIQLARRVMEEPSEYKGIVALNRKNPVMVGRPVNFPIAQVKAVLRGQALRALYPDDEMTERGWSHHVTDPLESLIQLAEAYTGSKGRFVELARYNRLKNPNVLRLGTEIVIPLHWIPESLGFRPKGLRKPLKLERDEKSGRLYAAYKVVAGDTLYSLLLRFTDRERADELNRMSGLLLRINGLSGEGRILAGRPMRIPLEWISEEHLIAQAGGKSRKPAERKVTARRVPEPVAPREKPAPSSPALRPPAPARPKTLAGTDTLHVIVDAGHGGSDPGAVYGKAGKPDHVFEHEVVYDIAQRLTALLKRQGFRVYPTLDDPANPTPNNTLSVKALGREEVRVTPPYRIASAKVGVNMRIYFINALYRRLTRKMGVSPDNVVLLSIHGDALAPTLRGAMVYYPDRRLRAREFQPRGRVYRIRQEAVPGLLHFRIADNRVAEEMSRDFAGTIAGAFKERRLGVSRRKPVRSYYYREGERTLPGVLRYSHVPTSVLVEVANLNNTADRRAMLQARSRQKVAAGLATALQRLRAERVKPLVSRKAG